MESILPMALGLRIVMGTTRMTTDAELKAKIEALRKSFTAGLAARFDELENALAQIKPGLPLASQSVPVKTILEQVHKIAGSAGTFGYAEMSIIASQAEMLCDSILKNQHEDDAAALRELRGKVADIRAEAAQ
jgi:HPt (histidine-containing phosphotransfer) domain-containing protein